MNTAFYYSREKMELVDPAINYIECVRLRMSFQCLPQAITQWRNLLRHSWENEYYGACMPNSQFEYYDRGDILLEHPNKLPAPITFKENYLHNNEASKKLFVLDFAQAKKNPMSGVQPADFTSFIPLAEQQTKALMKAPAR